MLTDRLIYRESWKPGPPVRPVTQDDVSHAELRLSLHGPGRMGLKKSHHDDIDGDPYYLWSGKCAGHWAVSLQHRACFVDLGGEGGIRWCSRQSGAHRLRLVIKLADGPWLVADQAAGASATWQESEFHPRALSWRRLDIEAIEPAEAAGTPDLHRVDAIGFSDLASGGGIDACSRLAWIEVRGTTAPRPSMIE
jgi:hypothetical protein